ncbi:hypothetical protein [Clostridium ljungdahlii]|uniref:Uncharacterized protein n=1 Tax=Clostridium ljungdahlii TaxID=1538 RepID=A0A162J8N8_9CLOT|nr:hypothetical protein [Clostridium ljungdahlii]OAA91885.1 hypothetical protein WY13_00287 [Clostridium ljungdahlii]
MKTAIYHYSLGKQKEVQASDFIRGSSFPPGKFTCPECGENVFLTSRKYSILFSHYEKKETSPECDRRVDGKSSLTIYERIGLPLYLRINNGNFYLSMGFRPISFDILQTASREGAYIEISENVRNSLNKYKYFINQERFYSDATTFIPIDFIPRHEHQYSISFSKGDSGYSLKKIWSDYADGFSNAGALFTSNECGGKKIRHGDSISSNKDYYWVRKDTEIPKYISGIEMKLCGNLVLKDEKYYVFKGSFIASLSNQRQFRQLAGYLKKYMKVFLLEKQPEIIPLWPPCVRVCDGYDVSDVGKDIFCNVVSGNETPKVFIYQSSKIYPREPLIKKTSAENRIISFRISSESILVNVDRKMISTGTYFKYTKTELEELESEIVEIENNEYCDVNSLHQIRTDKELKFQTLTDVEVIRVDRRGNISKSKSTDGTLEIKELMYQDRIYILSHNRLIYSANIEREKISSYDDIKLYDLLKAHNKDVRVVMPVGVRKIIIKMLISYSASKKYLYDYLEKNTIPVTLANLLGGNKNARWRL